MRNRKDLFVILTMMILLFALSSANTYAFAQNIQPTPTASTPVLSPTNSNSLDLLGKTKDIVSIVQGIIASAGIVIGLIAGYYKFNVGRVFTDRISANVEGKLIRYNGRSW